MISISGTAPEHLPLAEPIKDVAKKLKSANKKFKTLDSKDKKTGRIEEADTD